MATEQETPGTPPAEGGVALTDTQQAVLREHGIDVPEDGKIAVADHLKLLNTLSSLKQQAKQSETDKEQARLAAMNEAERKIEEARIAGRQEAEKEAHERVIKAQIKAEASAKGFIDPGDAFTMIPDLSALDAEDGVKAAVEKLAADKPYLVKTPAAPPLEQGSRGSRSASTPSGNDWLRSAFGGGA